MNIYARIQQLMVNSMLVLATIFLVVIQIVAVIAMINLDIFGKIVFGFFLLMIILFEIWAVMSILEERKMSKRG